MIDHASATIVPRDSVEKLARTGLGLLAAVGAASFSFAVVLQYGFNVRPCILCIYERIPYIVVAGLAGAGFICPISTRARIRLIVLCGFVFLLGSGLAAYHFGIEQHWWGSIAGCAVQPSATLSIEDLQRAVVQPVKPCDEVDWTFAGVSLAGYNALLSMALTAMTFAAARWLYRGTRS